MIRSKKTEITVQNRFNKIIGNREAQQKDYPPKERIKSLNAQMREVSYPQMSEQRSSIFKRVFTQTPNEPRVLRMSKGLAFLSASRKMKTVLNFCFGKARVPMPP